MRKRPRSPSDREMQGSNLSRTDSENWIQGSLLTGRNHTPPMGEAAYKPLKRGEPMEEEGYYSQPKPPASQTRGGRVSAESISQLSAIRPGESTVIAEIIVELVTAINSYADPRVKRQLTVQLCGLLPNLDSAAINLPLILGLTRQANSSTNPDGKGHLLEQVTRLMSLLAGDQ